MSGLILGRRAGESIKIGDEITITVHSLDRHVVRLRIDAPTSISVHRQEVWERIKLEEQKK